MPSVAVALTCFVIAIADGDTLTARCATPSGADTLHIRLAEIDAPEMGQAFGTKSREHLAGLCYKKPAVVSPRTRDRYGRTVAWSAQGRMPVQSRCVLEWPGRSRAT